MLNGPELYSDEGLSQGGLLLNKNEESDVSLPVDTLPQKGQEEELVMGSLLRFLTGQNG